MVLQLADITIKAFPLIYNCIRKEPSLVKICLSSWRITLSRSTTEQKAFGEKNALIKTDATFGSSSVFSPLQNTSQRKASILHLQHMTASYPHGAVYVIISYFSMDYILTRHIKKFYQVMARVVW